jgi:signal transduction histidine kinase
MGQSVDPDLVTAVAHDLKTPLSAIRGFLELMEHAGDFNEQQKYLSARILGALEHMQELIVDFEDVAQLDRGTSLKIIECDFTSLCEEAINIVRVLAQKQSITIDFLARNEAIIVSCDAQLIRRVIINLLANAIKYNNVGGSVHLSLHRHQEFLQIDVRDTGYGISEVEQAFVFDRFYRARDTRDKKISGSGLGLAIAKMIVEQHGGRIWLRSVPGEGSTFSFTLPLNQDKV